MKIAVTSTGSDLSSTVEARFGRCACFIILDTDTMEFEAIENPNIALGGGAGIQSAQLMSEKGVKTVLTGNCGPNAFQTFGAAGIRVITGVSGIVKDAVEQFKVGTFLSAEGPNVASHFGMGTPVNQTGLSDNSMETGGGMQRGTGGGLGMGRGMGRGMGGGRGMGRGMGQGMGGGMGRGMGRGMGTGMPENFQPAPPVNPGFQKQTSGTVSREQELAMLRDQAQAMEAQMSEINARIHDLDKGRKDLKLIACVETKKCDGCSLCLPECPTSAIALVDNIAQIDTTKCTGCGQCVAICPCDAISLKKG